MVRSRGPSHPDRLWEMRRPNALVGLCSDGERRHHGTPLHLLADWSDAHWKQKRPPVPPRGTKSSRHPLHISFLGPHHVYCCCFPRNNPAHTTMLPNKLIPDKITQMKRCFYAATQQSQRLLRDRKDDATYQATPRRAPHFPSEQPLPLNTRGPSRTQVPNMLHV